MSLSMICILFSIVAYISGVLPVTLSAAFTKILLSISS